MPARPTRDTVLWVALLLAHVAVPAGLWFTTRVGRPRFVGLGLYIAVALLLVDLLLLLSTSSSETGAAAFATVLDARFPTILLLASAVTLAIIGTGVAFYLGVTTVLVVVLVRSVLRERTRLSTGVDLTLISATSVLLLSGQVFTVAYYVSTADTLNHTSTAMVLRDAGFLQAISGTRFYAFSAFHVLSSVAMQFSGLNPRVLMGVLVLAMFQIVLLATYLFVVHLTSSRSLGVVGTVLVSINIAYLHYGSIAHYQSMSFLLFTVFLFLLFRGSWSPQDVTATVPILVTWTLTHHVSIVMAILLTSLPVAYLTLRAWRGMGEAADMKTTLLYVTFCLIFGVYWAIVTAKFSEIIVWVFFTSAAAEGIPSDFYIAQSYPTLELLVRRSIPFFIDSLHYSFLLAIAAVGVWMLVRTNRLGESRWRVALLCAIPATILYFPNPAWVPLEGLVEFNRWRLMVLPFLVLLPAVGLRYAVRTAGESRVRTAAVVLVTTALVFTTVASGVTHPGLTDLAGIQKDPREHLTGQELDASEFVFAHMVDDHQVSSRSDMYVYLRQYAWARDTRYDRDQFRTLKASHADRRLVSEPELTVVSVDAFDEEGIMVELVDVQSPLYDGDIAVRGVVSSKRYEWNRQSDSVVYSSGTVVIQRVSSEVENRTSAASMDPPTEDGRREISRGDGPAAGTVDRGASR